MNKKIKKYVVKYTLEFFVIVLGISFSFMLQNIRQQKEIDSKRTLIMTNLLNELESNQTYIKKKKIDFLREMDYVYKLLNDSLTKKEIKEYPSNYSPINPFMSALTFSPSSSIYNSLVNDGSLNLIESPSLKALIDEIYKFNYNSLANYVKLETEVAKEAERFFIQHHSEIYVKNFWFHFNDEKLINSVFDIIKKDNHFKALMVQKMSFMEAKINVLKNYSEKRDRLISLLKK